MRSVLATVAKLFGIARTERDLDPGQGLRDRTALFRWFALLAELRLTDASYLGLGIKGLGIKFDSDPEALVRRSMCALVVCTA
jgi:hypothetical protein